MPGSICIIGPYHLQNQLLKGFLTRQMDCLCRCQTVGPALAATELLLVDCAPWTAATIWSRLQAQDISPAHETTALFNVDPSWDIATAALDRGVRGIFHADTTPEQLIKGIKAILAGELWYSRKTLAESIQPSGQGRKQHNLTERERQILLGIAQGNSNKDIARSLGISQHTVKTHVYNIYRKLNVSRRLKAAQWASLNLND